MAVSGYASSTSVVPGGRINFHLSSDGGGPTTLTVARVGTRPCSTTIKPKLSPVAIPAVNPQEGFGWPAATTFSVPVTWPTGLYRLSDAARDVLWFVVRPAAPGAISKVLFQVAFLTPAAYNNEGGKSLYGFNSGGEANRASRVSLDRPWATDWRLIAWLEAEGIEVEYCSSVDLHALPNLLGNDERLTYECLVIAGHDEYWTKPMRDQTERFIANGGNVIVLSGNTWLS